MTRIQQTLHLYKKASPAPSESSDFIVQPPPQNLPLYSTNSVSVLHIAVKPHLYPSSTSPAFYSRSIQKPPMENLLGLLRIRIKRGIDLAIRDFKSSDPYVVVRLGKQKLKTRVVRKCLNPEWNEDLTLCVTDPNQPVKLMVYDKDTFTFDDKMGDAEFDIKPFLEAVKMNLKGIPSGTIITRLRPGRQNCLIEESDVAWVDGEVVQNMFLRLRNVERGEVELELRWTDVPGARGL